MPVLFINYKSNPLGTTSHTSNDGPTQCKEAQYALGWEAPRYPLPTPPDMSADRYILAIAFGEFHFRPHTAFEGATP